MVRIGLWQIRFFRLDRRELMAGLGAAVLIPSLSLDGGAQARLRARPASQSAGMAPLRPGAPDTPIWSLGTLPQPIHVSSAATNLEVTLENGLAAPVAMNWRGIDGVQAAEPLAIRAPLAAGARKPLTVPLRHAGTFLCDLRLLGDGRERPSPALPLIVAESEPVAVDRDEVLLIEDWRLRPDGTAIAPGIDPKDAPPLYTINGLADAGHRGPPPTSGCGFALSMAANAMLLLSK